jgi:hypothetical protein
MADDDPPPNVDRRSSDAVNNPVQAFLDVMEAGGAGSDEIAPVVRQVFNFKVSLYLSVDDPNITNAVRNEFAKWLNELSKFQDLKGANLRVFNCENVFLLGPSLLQGKEFQLLTNWTTAKSGNRQNVYICVKMQSSVPFSKLKHRMKPFLYSTNMFMKRNHSLGDSSEEMATLGYLSPVHPDLRLDNIQMEMNKEIQCINAQKDDDFLAEHGVFRGVLGEIVIAHGAVRVSSKKHGVVNNSKAVIVECPKSKIPYYLQTVQDSLHVFDWSPDMQKVKFVPFSLKNDPMTKEVFTDMLVYNSLENNKKAFAQILGVSRDDMLELRGELITKGPTITHVEPTTLTDKQGRWRIYTSKDKIDSLEHWLKANIAVLVESLDMRSPVPGFETPRCVLANRISSHHVQEMAAIAKTVPNLEDDSSFPNLVIRRGRHVNQGRKATPPSGAWSVPPPLALNSHVTPASPAINHQQTPPSIVTPSTVAPTHLPIATSPVVVNLLQQLEENKAWRINLEQTRAVEHEENQALRGTITSLQIEFKQHMADTNLMLAQLTEGQTGIQTSMTQGEHDSAAMRQDIADLTVMIKDLLNLRSSTIPLSTPPRCHRTDSDHSLSVSQNSLAVLATAKKRSPDDVDRPPGTPNPGFSKTSRVAENMNSDDVPPVRHHP